jgi:hyaluronan synthase/N-acetylglucosaminyltransferase
MIWTLKSVKSHHWYLIYDLLAQLILPFMLIIALVATAAQAVANQDISYVWKYFLILFGIALLRAAYGIYRTKDFGFLRFLAYGLMHVFILIPTRMYALVTIGRVKWGTR